MPGEIYSYKTNKGKSEKYLVVFTSVSKKETQKTQFKITTKEPHPLNISKIFPNISFKGEWKVRYFPLSHHDAIYFSLIQTVPSYHLTGTLDFIKQAVKIRKEVIENYRVTFFKPCSEKNESSIALSESARPLNVSTT